VDGPPRTTEYAADLAVRAACQVGQFFEKQGDKDLADGFIVLAARQIAASASSGCCTRRTTRRRLRNCCET